MKGMKKMTILDVQNVQKTYTTRFGTNQVQALSDVSFSVEYGEYVAIMGESGAGKTTLLNILATLDRPTSGKVIISGTDVTQIKESELATYRRENLGFVFQDFNLLDTFSIRDIFLVLLFFNGAKTSELNEKLNDFTAKYMDNAIVGAVVVVVILAVAYAGINTLNK